MTMSLLRDLFCLLSKRVPTRGTPTLFGVILNLVGASPCGCPSCWVSVTQGYGSFLRLQYGLLIVYFLVVKVRRFEGVFEGVGAIVPELRQKSPSFEKRGIQGEYYLELLLFSKASIRSFNCLFSCCKALMDSMMRASIPMVWIILCSPSLRTH